MRALLDEKKYGTLRDVLVTMQPAEEKRTVGA